MKTVSTRMSAHISVAAFALVFGCGVALGQNIQGRIVNPFDGSVSFAIPISGGVSLNYSSSQAPTMMSSENRDFQSGWVGAGWILGIDAIEADLKGTTDISDDEWFIVSPTGGKTKVFKDSLDIMRPQNNPYWRVVPTVSGDFVIGVTVVTDNGTQMIFGDFQAGIGTKQANRCVLYWGSSVTDLYNGSGAGTIVYRWDISQVINPYGIVLYDFYYYQDTVSVSIGGASVEYTRASYIDRIINRRTGQKIQFVRGSRDASEYQSLTSNTYRIQRFETMFLDSIKVFPKENATGWIQAWDFSYHLTGTGARTKRVLDSLKHFGSDGSSLPSLRFRYDSSANWLLHGFENPSGDSTAVTYTQTSIPYFNSSGGPSTTVIGSGTEYKDRYASSSSTSVIASYDRTGRTLRIRKWIGTWVSHDFQPDILPQIDDTVTLRASEEHVLLAYKKSTDLKGRLVVYDWRDDIQQWQTGFSVSASDINAGYVGLRAGMSATGSRVALIAGDSASSSNTLQLREWNLLTYSWGSPQTTSISKFPMATMLVSDHMVFLDHVSGAYILQWKKSGGIVAFASLLALNSQTDQLDRQYSLLTKYIGQWHKTNRSLFLYKFVYNSSTGYFDTTGQSLGTFNYENTGPIFTENRIALGVNYQVNGARLLTWKRTETGFTQLTSFDVATYWSGAWTAKICVNNDWLFLMSLRNATAASPPYEGRIFSFPWDQSSDRYSTADSSVYTYEYIEDWIPIPFHTSEFLLTDKFLAVCGMDTLSADGAVFFDTFILDRVQKKNWPTTKTELLFGAKQTLRACLGVNSVGFHSTTTGTTYGRFLHDLNKSWSTSISVPRVTRVTQYDGMGSSVEKYYGYDASPSFDPSLSSPGFGWVRDSLGYLGSSKISFNKSYSQPRLRGMVTKQEQFKLGGNTVVAESQTSWSVYQNPNKWYFYQLRRSQTSKTLDGVTATTYYAYNDGNGQVAVIREDANVKTESTGLRDRATYNSFAFEQPEYSSFKTKNMLRRPYESSTLSCEDSSAYLVDSDTGPLTYQFQVPFPQKVYFGGTASSNHARLILGTSMSGSEIGSITYSNPGPIVFDATPGTTYFLEAQVDEGYGPPQHYAEGGVGYIAGSSIAKQRTEYDSLTGYAVRTLQYDGSSWVTVDSVVLRDSVGNILDRDNVDKVRSSTIWGFNATLPIAQVTNAGQSSVLVDDFDEGNSLGLWTRVGDGDGDTQWSLVDGQLKQVDDASAVNEELDRIQIASTSELTGEVVFEFDLKIGDSNNWDFTIAAGGNGWSGVHGYGSPATEEAIWTAINNESWYFLSNTGWLIVKSGLTVGETYHLKIVAKCATGKADYFVDGVKYVSNGNFRTSSTGIDKIQFGNYGYGTTTSTWYVDNVRFYPAAAFVSTSSYDSTTSRVKSTTDASGVSTYLEYDGFGRVIRTRDDDRKILTESSYLLSRESTGGSFDKAYPNMTQAVTYPQGRILDGNVASWRFEGSAQDETGGLALSIQGATPGKGFLEKSYSFDGSTSRYLYTTSVSQLKPAAPTVEAWIKPQGSGFRVIADMNIKGASNDGRGYYLAIESNGKLRFAAGVASGSFLVVDGATVLQNGKWYHVVGTYTGSALEVYVNGVRDAQNNVGSITIRYDDKPGSYGPDTSSFYVGILHNAYSSAPTYAAHLALPFNGDIDELRVYDRSLSSAEISALAGVSVQTSYSDALGRLLQVHNRLRSEDLVSAKAYDEFGRMSKSYRSYLWDTGLEYDSLFSSHAGTQVGSAKPYAERLYYSDALSRDSILTEVDQQSTNEQVSFSFGSQTVDGVLLRYREQTIRMTSLATPVATRTYSDILGRDVLSRSYGTSGTTDTIANRTFFTMMGQPYLQFAPEGDSTYIRFDFLGRSIEQRSPDRGTSHYAFDRSGRIRFMVDSAGSAQPTDNVSYWKYDGIGRVIEKGYIEGPNWSDSFFQDKAQNDQSYPSTPSTWRTKYVYDTSSTSMYSSGRVVSVFTNSDESSDNEVEDYFSYDKRGGVVSKTAKVLDYTSTSFTTTYSYDLLGRITLEQYPSSSFGDVTLIRSYDMLGRTMQVGQSGGNPLANYTYDSLGQLRTEVLNPAVSGGMTRTFAYNKQGVLSQIANSLFEQTLRTDSGYTAGEQHYHGLYGKNRTNYGFASPPGQQAYFYKYDKYGRLIRANNGANNAWDVGVLKQTAYDSNGNLDSLQRGVIPAKKYAYYSGTNRLENIDGSGSDYAYDESGNAVDNPSRDLFYDPFTMMTQRIEIASDLYTSFQYDGINERVLKYEDLVGNITSTMYVRGLESYPLMHKVSSGMERMYVYGPTGLIAYREDSTWFYVHKDHLGSVRLTATASNTKDDYYDYDPYGRTIRSSVAGNASKYLFTGQEFDTETGLYNFRARMYDTTTGMFYAVDPMKQTHSPYGYALNNPVKYTDPTGMKSPDDLPEAPFPTRDSFGELEASIQAEYNWLSGNSDPRTDWDEDGVDDDLARDAEQRARETAGRMSDADITNLQIEGVTSRTEFISFLTVANLSLSGSRVSLEFRSGQLVAVRRGMPINLVVNGAAKSPSAIQAMKKLSTALGKAGTAVGAVDVVFAWKGAAQTGSYGHAYYATAKFGITEAAALAFGASAGFGVGMAFLYGEIVYSIGDIALTGAAYTHAQFESALNSGWYPFR